VGVRGVHAAEVLQQGVPAGGLEAAPGDLQEGAAAAAAAAAAVEQVAAAEDLHSSSRSSSSIRTKTSHAVNRLRSSIANVESRVRHCWAASNATHVMLMWVVEGTC
jgi:hypothetical protein